MTDVTVEVRPATLAETLETIAEAFDLRAHTIAERYDDIDDWETKMALAESRADTVREAANRITTLEAACLEARSVFQEYVRLHRAKNPPDETKAQANFAHADRLGNALAGRRPPLTREEIVGLRQVLADALSMKAKESQ